MTSLIFIGFIHRAGGQIFTPDLAVGIDSQPTYDALEFYKSMKELCPPGATNYSWGESLTAFVSGATATGIYAGRVLANVTKQNPKIADSVTCVLIRPSRRMSRAGPSTTSPPSSSEEMQHGGTKAFAAFLFQPEGYIKQLFAAPGHYCRC